MANRTGKKGKKPLQTTLGKANCQNEKDVDLSHIQKPINTSIFGLRQVLSLFQTATKEVKNYITYECDIMYECRTCRTIFRSLANFILHKRDYCRERINQPDILSNSEEPCENTCSESAEDVHIEDSTTLCTDKMETDLEVKKSLLPVIDRLKEKQKIFQLTKEVLNQDLSNDVGEESNELNMKNKHSDLLLEEIATNNAAVFQTVMQKLPNRDMRKQEFMKSEVMEIHGILDSDEAVLGPDGKICTFETNKINENSIIPKNDLFCTECSLKFSTRKTLTYHIKYKHNNTRLVYVCPDCKDTFANAWCVYRHLFKIHRKTSAQIKKMRDLIHNSCIRKDQEPAKKKDKKTTETLDKADEENQWLSSIEGDNDFQMCGGCGKRFERKAALHSHAQMCTKRIAVCNTIKENNAKKKEEEVCKDSKNKTNKTDKTEVLKGSSKRKPYLLRTYKFQGEDQNNASEKSLDNCDVNANKASKKDVENCDLNANCEIVETTCNSNKDVADTDPANVEKSSLSCLEELSSKKDFVSSPSIEKIDTEKMLNIIGITNNYENKLNENMHSSKSSSDDEISKSDQEGAKEVSRSHTARDFDLFCQSVAKSLFTDPLESSPELEEYPQKITKTIPLILRRKNNSSRLEKRNAILDRNNETPKNDLIDEKTEVVNKTSPEKMENIAQTVDTDEITSNPPSSSNFKISLSVKSLEDLIGVSPQDHKKNLENKEIDEQIIYNRSDQLNNANFPTNSPAKISEILRANVSPNKLQESYPKCFKRKRTSSFDVTECHGYAKVLKNTQDNSFISKASPFMDQNKLLCIPCQMIYPTLSKLLWHMSAHFSWFRFQCSRCSFISFNKIDCANHARRVHKVKKASVQSVVLPIPNWKTVLMSHDFTILSDEDDLSGKHTDEVLSGNLDDDAITDKSGDEASNDERDEWSNKLFLESSGVDYEVENDPLRSDTLLEQGVTIKQESIDVIENDEESFQIEVPQEMYTLNASEIIEGVRYEERYICGAQIKRDPSDDENDEENDDFENYIPILKENEIIIDDTKPELKPALDDEIEEHLSNDESSGEVNKFEDHDSFSKNSEQTTNLRPTRNRTRSIKTIQDDFFYDLNKIIKLNDTSVSKSNMQKHKKLLSQKSTKDNSSNGKSDSQSIRVYAKK